MSEPAFKRGDIVTIAGCHEMAPNTNRRWWQFWKPRMVRTDKLAKWIAA